jgi:hypothetical protein
MPALPWDLARFYPLKPTEGMSMGPFTRKWQAHQTKAAAAVQNGMIADRWGEAKLLSVMQQIGGWTPRPDATSGRHVRTPRSGVNDTN